MCTVFQLIINFCKTPRYHTDHVHESYLVGLFCDADKLLTVAIHNKYQNERGSGFARP